jgi:hypothetical protein
MEPRKSEHEQRVEAALRENIWQPLIRSEDRSTNMSIILGLILFPIPYLFLRLYLRSSWWEVLLLGTLVAIVVAFLPFLIYGHVNTRAIDRAAGRFAEIFPADRDDYEIACRLLARINNEKNVIKDFKTRMMIQDEAPGPAKSPQDSVLEGLDLASTHPDQNASSTDIPKTESRTRKPTEKGRASRHIPLEIVGLDSDSDDSDNGD